MKNNKKFWDEILNGEKLMTDKEADEMIKITKEFRKEDLMNMLSQLVNLTYLLSI